MGVKKSEKSKVFSIPLLLVHNSDVLLHDLTIILGKNIIYETLCRCDKDNERDIRGQKLCWTQYYGQFNYY
jgi:hypothetical protein